MTSDRNYEVEIADQPFQIPIAFVRRPKIGTKKQY